MDVTNSVKIRVSGSKLSLYSISNNYATSFLNLTAALRNVASPEAAEKIEERANYYLEIDRTLEAKMQELDNYIPERE